MRKPLTRLLIALLGFGFGGGGAAAEEAVPRVVTSIKPVHGLAAAVMEGVATPRLLVDGGQSPHSYDLRPSEALALEKADLVIWVGPALESFLTGPVDSLPRAGAVLTLQDVPAVYLRETRVGGVWGAHSHGDHDHGHDHDHDHEDHGHEDHGHEDQGHEDQGHEDHGHDHEGHGQADAAPAPDRIDPHIWLDPANARVMVTAIAARLQAIDPARADTYAANAEALRARIAALDETLAARLDPVRGVPYVVFHDAYQYFEAHYGLNAVGSVTLSPERTPSARRLHEVRQELAARDARCVFREPQFAPDLVDTVAEGRDVRVGVLDPLGADLKPGPEAYDKLLRGLADNLTACLAR